MLTAQLQESQMSDQDKKCCFALLSSIKKHASSTPFLNPVSAALVPDYYDIITEPTDLSTMTFHLSSGVYPSPVSVLHDLKLLFKNCILLLLLIPQALLTTIEVLPCTWMEKKLYDYTSKKVIEFFPNFIHEFESEGTTFQLFLIYLQVFLILFLFFYRSQKKY